MQPLGIIFLLGIGISIIFIGVGFHKIEEGYVGIYYHFGALQKEITKPGFHYSTPIMTSHEMVQISIQTDVIKDVPCGTKGGVMVIFEKIEVVNQLKKDFVYSTLKSYGPNYDKIWIVDKVHHEINQYCSSRYLQEIYIDKFESLDEELIKQLQKDYEQYVPGLEIQSIRVTKPKIPAVIRENYEEQEKWRTKFVIAERQQQVLMQQSADRKQQKIIKAQSGLEVSKIENEKQVHEKKQEYILSKIENEMAFNKAKSQSDADYYEALKELETLEKTLSESYLKTQSLEALTSNLKLYLGNHIPTSLGSAFQQQAL